MRKYFLLLLLFSLGAHAQNKKQNKYCDKYKNLTSFFYQNAKTKACVSGQKAHEYANPKFCQDLSLVSGKKDEEIYLACQDGFMNAGPLEVGVTDSTRIQKEEQEEAQREEKIKDAEK